MKPVLQSEAAECGIACLLMVANHHGLHLDMRQMRQRYPLSLKGMTLARLIAMAGELGLDGRPLRIDIEQLDRLKRPCILHWDMNHFVVLVKVASGKVVVFDPALGRRELTLAEVSDLFTGVALELKPSATFRPKAAAPAVRLRELTGQVQGLGRTLGLVVLLSLTLQVFVVCSPFLLQWVVDQVLVSADRSLLTLLGVGFVLLTVSQVCTSLLRGWAVILLSSQLSLQWMGNVFSHLLKLPLDFFEKRHLGDVVSRMDSVRSIQKTMTTSFVEAMIDGLMTVVTLVMMFVYSWKVALISVGAMTVYLCVRASAFDPLRSVTERQMVAAADQQTHLLESIRGMQSIKIAGTESARRSKYLNLLNESVNQEVKLGRLSLGLAQANQLILGLERVAVIWVGAVLAMDGVFSVGMLIAFLAYREQFTQRVSSLIDKAVEFRMLRLYGERLADIVLADPEPEAMDPTEAVRSIPEDARIEVRDLSFRYADGEPWVLKDCSFSVSPGQSLAIVGVSGCGKTTLVKLMLGLMTPTSGTIEVGGVPLDKLGPRNFRAIVGAVMQDDQLFAGSIGENIAFGEESGDAERTLAAARMAAVHDEVASMPMGYHSLIGDMGTTLSGGQKQRVILARALYRNPKILFLDEATSHLDVERERLVNQSVRAMEMTRIIVAHRPETIASADRVVVLEQGRIVRDYLPDRVMRNIDSQLPATRIDAAVETLVEGAPT